MKVIYRQHAREQMKLRSINECDVEYLLSHGENNRIFPPDGQSNWISNDKFCFHRYLRGRSDNQIAVIACFPKDLSIDWEVITVMHNFGGKQYNKSRDAGATK